MPVSLSAVARNDGRNTRGYSKLYGAHIDDVSAIPAASSHDVATAITMESTKLFYEFGLDHERGAVLTTSEESGEGIYGQVTYNLEFHIAGKTAAIKAALDGYAGVPLILIGKRKSDGVMEIIGNTDEGMVLRVSGTETGYDVAGTHVFNHEPYDYSDGTVTTS